MVTNPIDSARVAYELTLKCDSLLNELSSSGLDSVNLNYDVPNDFTECLITLDSITNPAMREWIMCLPDEEFSKHVRLTLGMHLRNNWGLWKETELTKDLHSLGIIHPESMSAIILNSYQRRVKGENLELDKLIHSHQEAYRKNGVPVDSIFRLYISN